ncbi:MAG: prenyltransferase [Actinomycetota bacterium]
MSRNLPHLPGILTTADLQRTADSIESLQLPNGMIPWFPGGHCDPWNHVETAIALDIMGRHDAAARAYGWLADIQHATGSWSNYYASDGTVIDAKLDTNVCAYVATGVWAHWLCTRDTARAHALWPVLRAALDWVLDHRRHDGTVLWARETDAQPWDYALLTGSSSIRHALHCGAALGDLLGDPHPEWTRAANAIDHVVATDLSAFEPKDRWAMDWYYPVLTGSMTGARAKARLAEGWDRFVLEDRGVRCVDDEHWVTAAETSECAIAHCAAGDRETARELLLWTMAHRRNDGAYWTGIVYPVSPDETMVHFPADEHTAYTAAAIIMAADAISGGSHAATLFTRPMVRHNAHLRARAH